MTRDLWSLAVEAHISTSRNTKGGRAHRDELMDNDVLVDGSERLHGAYTIRMYRAPAPVCTVHSAPVVSVVLCIRLERVQSDPGTPAVILRHLHPCFPCRSCLGWWLPP